MQISNNNPQSFGSIQVNLSKMNSAQWRVSDRLFNSIKYSEKYSRLTSDVRAGDALDIYFLPKSARGIEVRFIDPYSGQFVRDNNKIIKGELFSTVSDKVESVTDKIVNTYEKIINGVIKRPEEDIAKVIKGDTEMCKINPSKEYDFSELISEQKRLGLTQEEAEEQAFEQYKDLYHIDNKDADF